MVSIFSRLVEAEEVEMTIGCYPSSRRAHGAVGGGVGMNSGTFYRHLPVSFCITSRRHSKAECRVYSEIYGVTLATVSKWALIRSIESSLRFCN